MLARILGTAALAAGLTFMGQAIATAAQTAGEGRVEAVPGATLRTVGLMAVAGSLVALFLYLVPVAP